MRLELKYIFYNMENIKKPFKKLLRKESKYLQYIPPKKAKNKFLSLYLDTLFLYLNSGNIEM